MIGFYNLYWKETLRFLKVYNQTLIAPLINSLLLLAVFSLAVGDRVDAVNGIDFTAFIIPGLIMMTMIQNAFANTSSSLTFGKVLGSIIDFLIPPLSPRDLIMAIALGGVTRGLFSGLVVAVAVYIIGFFFVDSMQFSIFSFFHLLFFAIFASLFLALVGMIIGIVSDNFDQVSAFTSFIITPLSFLSGTFYSVKNLPEFWKSINEFNPMFHMIDGFRYAFTGYSDSSIEFGMGYLLIGNAILFGITYKMIASGYKIKS